MIRLVIWAFGLILSAAFTYMGAALLVFVLYGGINNSARGQAGIHLWTGKAVDFLHAAGPGFGELLRAVFSSLSQLVGG